jgi:PAS domain S-box-containing protein
MEEKPAREKSEEENKGLRERVLELEEEVRARSERHKTTKTDLQKSLREIREAHAAMENSVNAIFTADLEGKVKYANPSAAQMWGFESPRDMVGTNVLDYWTEESQEAAKEVMRITLSGQGHYSNGKELVGKRKDGTEFFAETKAAMIKDESGKPTGMVASFFDVTDRKKAEETLTKSLEETMRIGNRLNGLLQGARAILEKDDFPSTARKIFDNCKRLIGATAGYVALLSEDGTENEVVFLDAGGRECSVDPALPMPIRGLRGKAHHTGKVVYDNDFNGSEWMKYMPEGHVRLDNVLFVPLNLEGKTVGLMGLANKPSDFTEDNAKIAEAFGELAAIALKNSRATSALRESEARYRELFEKSPVGIGLATLDGKVLTFNRTMVNITGYSAEEFRRINLADTYVNPEDRKALIEAVRQNSGVVNFPAQLRRKDGTIYDALLCVSHIHYPPYGKVLQTTCVDITEQRKAEEEKRKLEEQLRHAQKMEAIGQLAGGIAHDFNNLLQGILGYSNLLKIRSSPESNAFKAADVIEKAGERAAKLTRQLLGFARKGKLLNAPVDIHKTIYDVVSILGHTIDKRIDKTERLRANNPYAKGDPSQLEQVIMNIAINASQAMPDGGELTFETNNVVIDEEDSHKELSPGNYLLISVKDTGVGIPKEIQDKIYEPFFTTKGVGEGTGMGLATVYGIVKNHHGSIKCESEEGKGTIFRIYLPVAEEMAPVKEDCTRKEIKGKGKILVVDDEKIIRNILGAMLTSLGYDVVYANDGEQCVDFYTVHREPIDLVILDMVMPVMNGRDCFYALKEIDPDARVLLSTGQAAEEAAEELMKDGLTGFIQKPYLVATLSEAVASAMGTNPESL